MRTNHYMQIDFLAGFKNSKNSLIYSQYFRS